jgi:hypothetical protein
VHSRATTRLRLVRALHDRVPSPLGCPVDEMCAGRGGGCVAIKSSSAGVRASASVAAAFRAVLLFDGFQRAVPLERPFRRCGDPRVALSIGERR